MQSNYKRLGDYIQEVNIKNSTLKITNLIGVSIEKKFIKSVANTIGVDMSNYKIIQKNQLACKLMSVGRDEKLPVDLYIDEEPSLVSSAYYVFEPTDKSKLLPEYLKMWLFRSETDRYVGYVSGGDVRGGISWDTFCEIPIKVPSIEKQQEIINEYHIIQNRIALNNQLISKLEDTAQTIYKQWFVKREIESRKVYLDEITSLITDGKHGNCQDEENSGYYFLSAKDVRETLIFDDSREIKKSDFQETHKRTNLKANDICLVNTGATIGRMCLAPDDFKTEKTTFQKSVAIIKPKKDVSTSYFLYSLLINRMDEIIELGKGTSQANLLLGDLKKIELNCPNFDLISDFDDKVKPIFKLKEQKIKENQKLEELKELLLGRMTRVEN